MSIENIARIIGATDSGPGPTQAVSGWSIDSRTVAAGDCFFALRGPNHDGHEYVASVFERGAKLAIVDRETGANGVQLRVPDTTVALQTLGHAARQWWGG